MQLGADVVIRQKFTNVIDTEEEARNFGEECAKVAWAFMGGFGEVELEIDDG